MSDVRIQYQEAELSDVVRYYVEGLKPVDGERITSHDYFVDPSRGKVILRLYVEVAALATGEATP
jgi:hypothetical protein